ncbi:MAG: UDP-3-O-[3-hydroxymyristoyl] N-acetylglucosamine deacetylase [Candidatus Dadabacteria bacterium]|nr:MAG: UDP-3-O-[3-hydroxymyristoyl] N-acetylglucosamine deacetylase [Candidatus Dadabacteria bacterium]
MKNENIAFSEEANSCKTVVVIDDEQGVLDSINGVLSDEGYRVFCFKDPALGLKFIEERIASGEKIDLALIDIWMPSLDGLELLRRLKRSYPSLPIIVISGHATVSTAVEAGKMGAVDLLEKPLELNKFLDVISKVLTKEKTKSNFKEETSTKKGALSINLDTVEEVKLNSFAQEIFNNKLWSGKKRKQLTLSKSAVIYGRGLHTGKKTGLILQPLEANSGIIFTTPRGTVSVPAHLKYVMSTGFATTISKQGVKISTIEHLMSALHAYGISNLLIKCDSEVPILDGSAVEFCRVIEEAGVVEQRGEWYELAVKEKIEVKRGDEFIVIEPAEEFIIDYTLSYPNPIGEQKFQFTLSSASNYKEQIAPARTFAFVKDIEQLQKSGLAQGGQFNNFLLIGENGAINDVPRFKDELVRHKILDCIGDLYLLGRPIIGKVTACKTGHSENIELLKEIAKAIKESTVKKGGKNGE